MHSGSSGLKLARQDPLPFTTMKIHASIAVISALIVSVLGFEPPQRIRVRVPALGSRRLMASPSSPFQALLSSTSDDNNDDSSHMKSSNDNNRLSKRYMAGTILFGLVAFILAAMPDRTKGVQLAGKYGGAAGYGLAAGTCHILSNAIKNNRLTTDSSWGSGIFTHVWTCSVTNDSHDVHQGLGLQSFLSGMEGWRRRVSWPCKHD